MSKDKTEVKSSCGCEGCASSVIAILVLWSLWWGLPTPWGKVAIDIFPPAIRIDGAPQ